MKYILLALMGLLVLSPVAMAQAQVQSQVIDANSPLYGLDVAFDNAMVNVGLAKASDVAHERASEMYIANENNQEQAMEKATNEFNKIAQAAKGDSEGLQKAERVLEQVRERVSEEGKQGIDTALSNLQEARNRGEENGNLDKPVETQEEIEQAQKSR